MLLPNFNVRSSGGASLGLVPDCSGARRGGLELVNQISGKMSRFDWTCAKERHGEQKLVWSPKPLVPVVPEGREASFRACFWAQTRLGRVVLIRVWVKVGQDET